MSSLFSGKPRFPRSPSLLAILVFAGFLLVPTAQALANVTVKVNVGGGGKGTITSGNGLEKYKGTPPLECHWNGSEIDVGTPESGKCENKGSAEGEFIEGTYVKAAPANGSEFAGWTLVKAGKGHLGCGAGQKYCSPYVFEGEGGELEVTAEFTPCTPGSVADSCNSTLSLDIEGGGEGEVEGIEIGGDYKGYKGEPEIECTYSGAGNPTGTCENTMVAETELEELFGEGPRYDALKAVPVESSEFVEWTIQNGDSSEPDCGPEPLVEPECLFSVSEPGEDAEVTAIFASTGYKLNLHTSGAGSGGFECEVDEAAPEPCANGDVFEEGAKVVVIPVEDTGSQFEAFTSANGGECTGATCEFEMNGEHTANAEFALEAFELELNESGPGELEVLCKEGASFAACAEPLTALDYGTEVKLTAKPDTGAETTDFEGTGSASGCEAEGSPCTFTIAEDSSATAEFALETFELELNESGPGELEVLCKEGAVFAACAEPLTANSTTAPKSSSRRSRTRAPKRPNSRAPARPPAAKPKARHLHLHDRRRQLGDGRIRARNV